MKSLKIEDIVACHECKSEDIYYDSMRGDIYCNRCGLVLEDYIIDQGPEWREFENSDDKARATVGKDLRFHAVLRTSFDPKESSKQNKTLVQRISKAQRYAVRGRDRYLVKAMILLEKLASHFEVSDLAHEEAALLYRKATQKDMVRGRSVASLGSACLYIASKHCGKVLNYKELAKQSEAKVKEISRCVRVIKSKLKLKHRISSPLEYTTQYLDKLYGDEDIKLEMQRTINDLQDKLGEENIGNPESAALALTYIAGILTGNKRIQKELAEVSKLTEVTLRNRYKEMVKILDIDLSIY